MTPNKVLTQVNAHHRATNLEFQGMKFISVKPRVPIATAPLPRLMDAQMGQHPQTAHHWQLSAWHVQQ